MTHVGPRSGIAIDDLEDAKVERVRGRSTGAGADGVFRLGVQARIPGADYSSIYAEGSAVLTCDFFRSGPRRPFAA
jgi:hypothetical protein